MNGTAIDTNVHKSQLYFGQHAFCVNVQLSDIEGIAKNLQISDIDVYDESQVPDSLKTVSTTVNMLVSNKFAYRITKLLRMQLLASAGAFGDYSFTSGSLKVRHLVKSSEDHEF